MKKMWIHVARSFKEADEFDDRYYARMSKTDRIDTMQFLRETYLKINRRAARASREGLRRFVRVLKQK